MINAFLDWNCIRKNVEQLVSNGFLNLTQAHQKKSKKLWRVHRDWNNAKWDALSLNPFRAWSEPDDIFVTKDGDFAKKSSKNRIERQVLTPLPRTPWPSKEPVALIEQTQTIRLFGVITG
jgi:hypothetical protein